MPSVHLNIYQINGKYIENCFRNVVTLRRFCAWLETSVYGRQSLDFRLFTSSEQKCFFFFATLTGCRLSSFDNKLTKHGRKLLPAWRPEAIETDDPDLVPDQTLGVLDQSSGRISYDTCLARRCFFWIASNLVPFYVFHSTWTHVRHRYDSFHRTWYSSQVFWFKFQQLFAIIVWPKLKIIWNNSM